MGIDTKDCMRKCLQKVFMIMFYRFVMKLSEITFNIILYYYKTLFKKYNRYALWNSYAIFGFKNLRSM